jgi:putative hydrolase of the HAD superfamily
MAPSSPSRPALLLDAMGTLLALAPPAPLLRRELAQRLGVSVTEAQARRALAAEIAYYRAHLQDGRDAGSLARLRERCAEALREALPHSRRLAAVPVAQLTETLLAALHFSAFADAAPALESVRARGVRVIVVSNWDVSLPEVLTRVGLRPLLDEVLPSAAVGARKPSPVIFKRALQLAGCRPEAALHVGDSLEEDIAGARAAGIVGVLVRRDGGAAPPGVPTIASLAQLGALLPGA